MEKQDLVYLAINQIPKIEIFSQKDSGIKTSIGKIGKILKCVYNSNSSEDGKRKELNNFINYIDKLEKNILGESNEKIMGVKGSTFLKVFHIYFTYEIRNLINNKKVAIDNIYYYLTLIERIFFIKITYNIDKSIILDSLIKQKELIKQRKAKKEEEEKARQEREQALKEEKLSKMKSNERFKFELDELKTDDEKEKYVTDKFNKLKTMQESEEKKLLAKVVIKYYKDKEKPSKKVKKKIEELEKML